MADQHPQQRTPAGSSGNVKPTTTRPAAPGGAAGRQETAPRKQETPANDLSGGATAIGFLARIRERRQRLAKKVSSVEGSVNLSEVKALIRFVSERGMDARSEIVGPLHEAIANLDLAKSKADFIAANEKVLALYSKLCELTYPTLGVNGRTIRNTSAAVLHMSGLIVVSLLFLAGAFASEIVQHADSANVTLESWLTPKARSMAKDLIEVVLEPLSPFFWGGVGSCIFLLKTLTDRMTSTTFDSRKLHVYSYLTRILLGAVLGYVVASLLFLQADLKVQTVGPDAIAFLAGLGTKAVYGGLETLIDTTYRRIVGKMKSDDVGSVANPPAGSAVKPPAGSASNPAARSAGNAPPR